MPILPFDWSDLDLVKINNQHHEAVVSLEGGQLLSWKIKNNNKDSEGDNNLKEILYHGTTISRTGIPILFPFADSLEKGIYRHTDWPIARHGFGRDLTWTLDSLTDDEVIIVLTHKDLSDELQQAYPFQFKVYLIMDFNQPKTLSYTIKVENLGVDIMAIAPGLHPYLKISDNDKASLKIGGLKDFDATKLNWTTKMEGGLYYDYKGTARIVTDKYSLDIQDKSPNYLNNFQQLVVWSQPATMNDSNFVCIEPFTRSINGINDDPILINSREVWNGILEFKVT